mgnify:CR=1 FL=1
MFNNLLLKDVLSSDVSGTVNVVSFVDKLLELSLEQNASDIHIEPFERTVKVRYRIDGDLQDRAEFPSEAYSAICARLKIMSGLNIAERRIPQDGRINMIIGGKEFDFRVSTLPTVFGEKFVIRILDKTTFHFTRQDLGFTEEENRTVDKMLKRPHGIILLTGPTGCGKSTTLYSFLKEVNDPKVNIVTVEDPVEFTMAGINQTQVNTKANMTFAAALRSILRQDPDIVMVGEIRDADTARTAIQASITGHLVLSSFHASSAPAAFSRMIDMIGTNPIFSSSIRLVIAQRLVRKLSSSKKSYQPDKATLEYIHKVLDSVPAEKLKTYGVDLDNITLYEPVPTEGDPFGYRGRTVIMEQLIVNDEIQAFIRGDIKDVNTDAITEVAIKNGMLTLEQKGVILALKGETSLEEVSRVI